MSAPVEPLTPRCRRCYYALNNLPTPGACPECGREFDLRFPLTYTTKPPFVRWTFWLPAWLLAVVGGILATSLTAIVFKNWGWAMWVGVPLSMGCILGYGVRLKWFGIALLCMAAALSLITSLMSMSLAGVYCGIVLTFILAGPIIGGAVLGGLTRHILKSSNFSQRAHLKLLAILALGPLWAILEGPPGQYKPESVTTREVIAAPVNAMWDSIVFFEEVTHAPPLILRIGLARPLYTKGSAQAVGDRKTCIYNKGHITKEVTQIQRGRLLAFDVIEQQIGYEHDVRLRSGSFALAPIDADHTELLLTTNYEPRLAPRFAWKPFEELAVHTLHHHVIKGMRLKAEHPAERPNADQH